MTLNITLQFISNGILVVIANPQSTQENPVAPHIVYCKDKEEVKAFCNKCVDSIKPQVDAPSKASEVVGEALDKVTPMPTAGK
jgi:hypothetical protein